jgi:hypothetical protein
MIFILPGAEYFSAPLSSFVLFLSQKKNIETKPASLKGE